MYSGWEMKCLHNLNAVCISNIFAYMNRGWFHKRFRIESYKLVIKFLFTAGRIFYVFIQLHKSIL